MEKFMKLPKDKRDRILNCAICEFGKNGYIGASTDVIALNSQISKGSLFNYFKNKKNLYIYTVEHIAEFLSNEILNKVEQLEGEDFFHRIKYLSILKQNMFIKYPYESNVLIEAFISHPQELKDILEELYVKYSIRNLNIIQDYIIKYIDKNMLKENISKEDTIFVVMTLFEALSKKYTQEYKYKTKDLMDHKDEIFKEFDKYIDIIKYGIYKS